MRQKPGLSPNVLSLAISLSVTIIASILLISSDEVEWWKVPPVSLLLFGALYATLKTEKK